MLALFCSQSASGIDCADEDPKYLYTSSNGEQTYLTYSGVDVSASSLNSYCYFHTSASYNPLSRCMDHCREDRSVACAYKTQYSKCATCGQIPKTVAEYTQDPLWDSYVACTGCRPRIQAADFTKDPTRMSFKFDYDGTNDWNTFQSALGFVEVLDPIRCPTQTCTMYEADCTTAVDQLQDPEIRMSERYPYALTAFQGKLHGWRRELCLQCGYDGTGNPESVIIKNIQLEQECLARLTKKSTPPSIPTMNYSENPSPSAIIDSIDDLFDHLDNQPCPTDLSCSIHSSDCAGSASEHL